MPRKQYSKSELYEYCFQFYSFLQTRHLTAEPTTKEKLRDVYVRDFRPVLRTNFPCFSMVMFNLKRLKFVSLRDKEIVTFLRTLALGQGESIQADKRCSEGAKSKKKKRLPQFMLSVDQHLAVKNKLKVEKFPEKLTSVYCNVCHMTLSGKVDANAHKDGHKHILNCCMLQFEMERPNMITSRHNIRIEARGVFDEAEGTYTLNMKCNVDKRIMLYIHNEDTRPVTLTLCEPLQYYRHCELDDPKGVALTKSTVTIIPGAKYDILAKCSSSEPGVEKIPVMFRFSMGTEIFVMVRYLMLVIEAEFTDQLLPTAPYKPPPRASLKSSASRIVPGRRIDKYEFDKLKSVIRLGQFGIPMTFRTLVNHGLKPFTGMSVMLNEELRATLDKLNAPLSSSNHYKRFQILLHLEEIQMEVDIRKYDMVDATLKTVEENRQLLCLEVPGLSEQRPSILKGDSLYVEKKLSANKVDGKEFEGFVHQVKEREIWIGFHESFHSSFINNSTFNVYFTFNRTPIRLEHRAISLGKQLHLKKFLFPDGRHAPELKEIKPNILLYNKTLEFNKEQLKAIEMIVCGSSGPSPYIIYGPPGTGKTVTLVEAMKQVAKIKKKCHILACAPSNSAADLITQRLLAHVPSSSVYRMYAMSRSPTSIPENIRKVSNYKKKGKFIFPSKEELMRYQFVVTTLITAGRIAGAAFPSKHFSHVFIDEAGQATEPEAMIGFAGILDSSNKNHGQLVLAGDPKQLGPVIRSPTAIKYGLETSYLERLMQTNKLYQRVNSNDFDNRFITKLLQNYRSHSCILKTPNELFYDNELKECADQAVTSSLCHWNGPNGLPKQGFPMIFHSIVSKEEREGRSPSFFNLAEVNVVMTYVMELLSSRNAGLNIKPSSIGIISPYNQQVRKIRKALKLQQSKNSNPDLKGKDLTAVTVGCTEEFQGQERLVIFISTVRSDPYLLQVDNKFCLGFLQNPKRFNVAMTRAKALLIVVGNPHILILDPNWKSFIQYCQDNGAMRGVPFNLNKDVDYLIKQFMLCGIGRDKSLLADNTRR